MTMRFTWLVGLFIMLPICMYIPKLLITLTFFKTIDSNVLYLSVFKINPLQAHVDYKLINSRR